MGGSPEVEVRTNKDGSVTVGPVNKYLGLIEKIEAFAEVSSHADRLTMQRLAWFLGEQGETETVERIMKHCAEPGPQSWGWPYGYTGHGPA